MRLAGSVLTSYLAPVTSIGFLLIQYLFLVTASTCITKSSSYLVWLPSSRAAMDCLSLPTNPCREKMAAPHWALVRSSTDASRTNIWSRWLRASRRDRSISTVCVRSGQGQFIRDLSHSEETKRAIVQYWPYSELWVPEDILQQRVSYYSATIRYFCSSGGTSKNYRVAQLIEKC